MFWSVLNVRLQILYLEELLLLNLKRVIIQTENFFSSLNSMYFYYYDRIMIKQGKEIIIIVLAFSNG